MPDQIEPDAGIDAETVPVYMHKEGDRICFQARAEGPDGMIGDLNHQIGPGGSAFGRSYDEWMALPGGAYPWTGPDSQGGRQ
jgi:hypothetical protein